MVHLYFVVNLGVVFLWEIPELSTLNRFFSGNIRIDQTFERCAVPYLYRFAIWKECAFWGLIFICNVKHILDTRAHTQQLLKFVQQLRHWEMAKITGKSCNELGCLLAQTHQIQALIHVFGQTGFLVAYTIKSATHPSVIDRFTSVSFLPLLPYTPTTDLTP